MTHGSETSVTETMCGSADQKNQAWIEHTVIAGSPEAEALMLAAKLAVLQEEYDRLLSDKHSLPQGWQAVQVSENIIRINALTPNGDMCHWLLDAS